MCCGGLRSRLFFRVAGPQGERLPMLEPEHLARRRRRVPAPTPGTVSPTALARRSYRSLQMGQKGSMRNSLGFPCALLKGHTEAVGGEPARPCPRGRAGALNLCPVSRPALSSLCCSCCTAVLSGLGTPAVPSSTQRRPALFVTDVSGSVPGGKGATHPKHEPETYCVTDGKNKVKTLSIL